MSKYNIGDVVIVSDPGSSSIPTDEEGHLAEVFQTSESGGRLKMITGPRPNHRWYFCDLGVTLGGGGPW